MDSEVMSVYTTRVTLLTTFVMGEDKRERRRNQAPMGTLDDWRDGVGGLGGLRDRDEDRWRCGNCIYVGADTAMWSVADFLDTNFRV